MSDIKLVNAAMDEHGGEIVLRGVLDAESLTQLQVADYQREVAPHATIKELAKALRNHGGVPDIQLGMRGGNYTPSKDGGTYILTDPVYIIDGLQRTSAAIYLLALNEVPRLGAVVYFNTDEEGERLRFKNLNVGQRPLSPNILMYNERHENTHVQMLHQLCMDKTFPMNGKVCWGQSMKRGQLITAVQLIKSTVYLHGRFKDTNDREILSIKIANRMLALKIPRMALRNNVKTFWQAIEDTWHPNQVVYRQMSSFLRSTFLNTYATILTRHEDFWNDSELMIPTEVRKKMASFPLNDPAVQQLCSGGGTAMKILYPLIVDHINSGRRTHRLTPSVKEVGLVEA